MRSAENPKDHKRQPPPQKSEADPKRREEKETFIDQTLAWLEESDKPKPPMEKHGSDEPASPQDPKRKKS